MKYITITDDGKRTTSELLKDIGCPYWSYLTDEELDDQFPPPAKKTSRKFKWIQGADPEHKNKSAKDCEKEGLQCITLRERLIMERLWFKKEGTHLDVKNITLCAGSRDVYGLVPSVDWDPDRRRLHVGCYVPQSARGRLRARAAVSDKSSTSISYFASTLYTLDGKEITIDGKRYELKLK